MSKVKRGGKATRYKKKTSETRQKREVSVIKAGNAEKDSEHARTEFGA